MMLGATRMLLR
jgi:hypothetical protein